MMLYLLWHQDTPAEDPYLVGVFTSEERAKQYAEALYEVEGFPLEGFEIAHEELNPRYEGKEHSGLMISMHRPSEERVLQWLTVFCLDLHEDAGPSTRKRLNYCMQYVDRLKRRLAEQQREYEQEETNDQE